MKTKELLLILVLSLFGSGVVSAQSAPSVIRVNACSVNDGYSMLDVVEFARSMDRSSGVNPSGIFFREAVVARSDFQNDWDFVLSVFYSDMASYVEHRGYMRGRAGGREGGLSITDMISCSPAPRVLFTNVANEGEIFTESDTTVMVSQRCDLNGSTLVDAGALAAARGEAVGAYTAIDFRVFGGPEIKENSLVNMRFVFPSGEEFGSSVDAVRNAGGLPQADSEITCSNGSIWLSHRIFVSN